MQESKEYRLTFSGPEIVAALKRAYPEHLTVQAIPHKDCKITIYHTGIQVSWVRQTELKD